MGAGLPSPLSKVLKSRNKPAASLMRLNSIQNAWTSMKRSCNKREEIIGRNVFAWSWYTMWLYLITLHASSSATQELISCYEPTTRDKFLLSASQHCGIEIKYLNWSILLCQDTANQPFTNFSFRSRALSITFFHQTKNIKRLMSTHARNKTLLFFQHNYTYMYDYNN